MSSSRHKPASRRGDRAHRQPAEAPAAGGQPSAYLAHELANLLDGSLRNVGLAIDRLTRPSRGGDALVDDEERLLRYLQAADQAMQRMAQLIRRWRSGASGPADLYDQGGTLSEAVAQVLKLLEPEAQARGVWIATELARDVIDLPAGPIGPVLLNALRNSLEAIAAAPAAVTPGRIELAAWRDADHLVLAITDDGPGPEPLLFDEHGRFRFGQTTKGDGRGLGLRLVHDLIAGLGGSVEINTQRPHGTRLTLRYPVPFHGAGPDLLNLRSGRDG